MTKKSDDNKRSRIGFICSLKDLGDGKSRLYFDDVVKDSSSTADCWKHEKSYTHKDYDIVTTENFKVSKNELAEIGLVVLNRLLARNQKKTDRKRLIIDIKNAFKDAVFPSHLGLIAAESIHDWETNKGVLEELTKRHDFNGVWWKIPKNHLDRGGLGLNYLDATGMAFYLPAFMTLALKRPEFKYISRLIGEFDPVQEETNDNHYAIFSKKFSKINGERKKVCIRFMHYMKEVLMLTSHIHIWEVERINTALRHEFWIIDSNHISP